MKYDIHALPRKILAELLGIDPSTISRWHDQGMPRNPDKTYDGPQCITWLVGLVEERVVKAAKGAGPTESADAQRWINSPKSLRLVCPGYG